MLRLSSVAIRVRERNSFHLGGLLTGIAAKCSSLATMSQETSQPNVILERTPDYREGYANSVQVQKSVWDFRLTFGTAYQETAEQITINTFQTVYLSPQQAKALCNVLGQNLIQYEHTFGTISLEPRPIAPQGPVH
jgi:hypothetical protein